MNGLHTRCADTPRTHPVLSRDVNKFNGIDWNPIPLGDPGHEW